jgi:hypothetical protein
MLATLTDPIKTSLNTTIAAESMTKQHVTSINLTPHTKSILGRTYWQLLTDPDITRPKASTPPLCYNQNKGLMGRLSAKMT